MQAAQKAAKEVAPQLVEDKASKMPSQVMTKIALLVAFRIQMLMKMFLQQESVADKIWVCTINMTTTTIKEEDIEKNGYKTHKEKYAKDIRINHFESL